VIWLCFGTIRVLFDGSFQGGVGRGSGEAQYVSDIKFQMSCHGHWAKKNSFLETVRPGFETTKDLNQSWPQVIMFYNLKGEKLCQNI